jgi:hypothetical protein
MSPLENGTSDARSRQFNLTTLDHCPEMLGQTAVERLDTQLRTNQAGVPAQLTTTLVEARWIEGATLPYCIKTPPVTRSGAKAARVRD